jgi:DNA-binding NarL/FixJ family response regulator
MTSKYLTPSTAPAPDILTRKEFKVLQLIASGLKSKEIAKEFGVSPRTVETQRAHILKKLKLRGIADLVIYSIKYELIDKEGNPTG